MTIETQRLQLISCDTLLFDKILEGEEALAKHLSVSLSPNWSGHGKIVFRYALDQILAEPEGLGWWTYLIILKKENTLIGNSGYKGKWNADGVVEIGYEIAKAYRNQGYATEMASALIEHAFQFEPIQKVIAHTENNENASTHVLQKCGMKRTQNLFDNEDGWIWRWEIDKK